MIDFKKLADLLLDTMCDLQDPDKVARFLHESGYSNDDLITLGFEPVEED